MLNMLFGKVGQVLEYAVDVTVDPGNPAMRRAPKVERSWLPFNAAVGTPAIPSDSNAELARLMESSIQIHTTVELKTDGLIRYEGREFVVMNSSAGPHVGKERLYRYICSATIKGDQRVV